MSNNLDLTQLASSQDEPEVVVNNTNGDLDAAISDQQNLSIDNTNARTLTNDEFRRFFLTHIDPDGGSTPTAAITVTVPAVTRGLFAMLNTTAQTVTVTISGQSVTAPTLANGLTTPKLFTCDGTNVRAVI